MEMHPTITDMYGYPDVYGQWSPSRRGYLQHFHTGTPLPPPYGQPALFDTGYYDTPYYMDYNTIPSPYPGALYNDPYIPQHWGHGHYRRPYYHGGILSSLFGYPGRRSRSSLYTKLNREQLQEEQLRQLRRKSDSKAYKYSGRSSSSQRRHSHDDNKNR
jgi:hypothetical protein